MSRNAVGILRKGQLILNSMVADLLHSQGMVEIVLHSNAVAQEIVAQLHIAESVIETQGNVLRISESAQSAILPALVNANIPIVSLNPISRTLEEVYVHVTQTADPSVNAVAHGTRGKQA